MPSWRPYDEEVLIALFELPEFVGYSQRPDDRCG